MMEMMVVIVVVAVALAWAGRAVWRSVKGKGACSSCAEAGSCPLVENPELLADLSLKGKMGHLDKCNPGGVDCKELLEELEAQRED